MNRRVLPRAVAVLALVSAAACHRLPPDPDGRPAGATTLALGATQTEQLNCDQGDCADWYVIDVPAKGKLELDLASDAATSPDVDVEVILYDAKGNALGSEHTGGKSAIELRAESAPATYYIAVGSQSSGIAVPYTLVAKNELPPPPKPVAEPAKKPPKPAAAKPVFETRRGSVLEIQDDGKSVLLDIGKSQGVRVGLRGRLIRGNATAGSLEITEVYPEGSLARVTGGKADANSAAEVDIPLGAKTP